MGKNYVKTLSLIPFALIASLFISLVVIGAGLGSFYPQVFKISGPIVCRGSISFESREYSYRPGQSGTEHKIYCVTRGGEREDEITMYAFVVSTVIYTLLLLPVLLAGFFLLKSRRSRYRPRSIPRNRSSSKIPFPDQDAGTAERLSELEQLKEQGLISDEEYRSKRSEILDDL